MRDPTFQDAYARVRGRYNDQDWLILPPREITNLIYREMREIDLIVRSIRMPKRRSPSPRSRCGRILQYRFGCSF